MAGTYDLVLLSSDGEIISAHDFPSSTAPHRPEITIGDFKLASRNANSVPMNDIRFTGSLTCKSGFFSNVLTVALFAAAATLP